jgi:hypothetical protein
MNQDWQPKKIKVKKRRKGSSASLFTGSDFAIDVEAIHSDRSNINAHMPENADQDLQNSGDVSADRDQSIQPVDQPGSQISNISNNSNNNNSDQPPPHHLHKHKKKRGRSPKYSLFSGNGNWQPDTPEQRLAEAKANSKHPELHKHGIKVRKKRDKSPDYSLFSGEGEWLDPADLEAAPELGQNKTDSNNQASANITESSDRPTKATLKPANAHQAHKLKVKKKHQKPDQTIIAEVGDWPDKESLLKTSDRKIKVSRTKMIGLLLLSISGFAALHGLFSFAGAKPISVSGVPLPLVMRSMLDHQTRRAYLQGDGDLLYTRLKEMGVEAEIREYYRQYIPNERELDQYVNQLMYDNTGYVNDDFEVDRNGQLIPKGKELEAVNIPDAGDRPPAPPGITKAKE